MVSEQPATRSRQPEWGAREIVVGLVGGFLATVVFGAILAAALDTPEMPTGVGARVGRAGVQAAAGEPQDPGGPELWQIAIANLPLWIGLLAAPLVGTRLRGNGAVIDLGLRFDLDDVPRGVAAGIVMQIGAAVYGVLLTALDISGLGGPANDLAARAKDLPQELLFIVMVVVLAPLAEELFYRGLVLRTFERQMAPRVAILASAALFAASHLQVLQFPALVWVGVVAGWLAQRYGRLGPAIIAHATFNGITALFLIA